jgi:putative ABC transport system permease protein
VPFMPEEFEPDSILVMGAGTDAAVAALPDEDEVLTRSTWLAERRDLALIAGVESAMLFAVVAVGLLSIVALVATVVAGARARGRALSLLRTLGMSPRLGWWLALAELAPLVLAAVIGGIVAGITVVLALAPSIGLDVLAGGTQVPDASFSPTVFIGLAGAALLLLLLGTLADVLVHRRDKLSEVLRVGETV